MISAKGYESIMQNLGREYFVESFQFVPDLASWAKDNNAELSEPGQLMKLVASGDKLTMFIQSEISEDALDGVINGLGVRWSLIDNAADISKQLNSTKKRLVYSFLKEFARTLEDFKGDELQEDEWAMKAMEKLGFFRE